ncbi:MAG TPA: EAL domain-containing protein [Gammaproteobacteria bacterium]|nr:EAL domain-containing protein [Gammaproteobacteria bacterium]
MQSVARVSGSFPGKHARFLGVSLLFAAFMFAASYLSYSAQINQDLVPLYPESGIGLALLWRYGARYWPAVFLSTTVVAFLIDRSWLVGMGAGWLDVLVLMVTLTLLTRLRVQPDIGRMRDLMAFVAAVVAGPLVALPVFVLRHTLVFGHTVRDALAYGLHYYLATCFSYLIVAPLILTWSAERMRTAWRAWLFLGSLAAIVLFGLFTVTTGYELRDRVLFLFLPFAMVCAVVARVAGASAAAFLIMCVLVAAGEREALTLGENILHAVFIATVTLTGYALAIVFNEWQFAHAELDIRARRDRITGLMNRYEFENRLKAALGDTSRRYALLYLDLDQFKLVNDTCGHLAGDRMLRSLGSALQGALRAGAILARLGGDEFGCLLADSSTDDAEAVARTLQETIRNFRYSVGSQTFTVGASIGVTFLLPDEDTGPDAVLGRADIACYTAKEAGRNRTYVYGRRDASMHQKLADIHELSQLQTALAEGQFELYAQRIADIGRPDDERPFYEVLLRYAEPDAGQAIAEMLKGAQRYGLSPIIDRWVFEQAAKFLGRYPDGSLRLTVNVTATTLESEGFEDFVVSLPETSGFKPSQLCLEITEAVELQHLTNAIASLSRLRERGFEIALDDFGAGVASFGYLSDLPVTIVKIDGRFVRDLDHEPGARIVIEALVRLAALRRIACIAEWVEDLAVIPTLRAMGVSYAQGYAIHRPEALERLFDTLDSTESPRAARKP